MAPSRCQQRCPRFSYSITVRTSKSRIRSQTERRNPGTGSAPGTGKSHLAQSIGQAAIQQGYRVLYRETHKLLDDLAEATIDGTRKEQMELFASVPLLIINDLGMRKLPVTAAEELLEIVMRR
ncbi:MAG: ATP-binding protein [Candidatus Sulfotelmatobacter sp.]